MKGEFENRIIRNEGNGKVIHSDLLRAWMDEARKEFPLASDPKYQYAQKYGYGFNMKYGYGFKPVTNHGELRKDREKWFTQWFGDEQGEVTYVLRKVKPRKGKVKL